MAFYIKNSRSFEKHTNQPYWFDYSCSQLHLLQVGAEKGCSFLWQWLSTMRGTAFDKSFALHLATIQNHVSGKSWPILLAGRLAPVASVLVIRCHYALRRSFLLSLRAAILAAIRAFAATGVL